MQSPHYLRVARALALITGLAGAGCSTATSADSGTSVDAAAAGDSATSADTGSAADLGSAIDLGNPGTPDTGTLADASTGTDASAGNDAGLAIDAGAVGDTGMVRDAALADAATADLGDPCASCDCGGRLPVDSGVDSGIPSCFDINQSICCAAVGPLFPPDLPV